jgi:hypothetical protein
MRLGDSDPAVTSVVLARSVLGSRAFAMLGDLLANLASRQAFRHRDAPFLAIAV